MDLLFRTVAADAVLAVLLATLIALGLAGLSPGPATAGPGDITLVAIDMDPVGNDDSSVGALQSCVQLGNIGDTHVFDLIVRGVHVLDRIQAYQIDIDYDPSVIRINSIVDADPAGSVAPGRDNAVPG